MRTVNKALRRRLTTYPVSGRTDQDSVDTRERLDTLVGILLFEEASDRPATPTNAQRTAAAARIWMHLSAPGADLPAIVIARTEPSEIAYNAGSPGPRFDTLKYDVACIDAGPNPDRAEELEAATLELFDAAPLFSDPAETSTVGDDEEDGLALLDVRATGRISRQEVLEQPHGSILWYRGPVIQVETET